MRETTTRGTIPEDHRLPPGANGRRAVGSDPDRLRGEIEATRARMSRTLDELEGTLVRQKEEVVARVTLRDLRARISTSPLRPLLIAFAAGYIVAAIRD